MIAWLGAALIAIVASEVFQDLFHSAESGALSGWIGRKLPAAKGACLR